MVDILNDNMNEIIRKSAKIDPVVGHIIRNSGLNPNSGYLDIPLGQLSGVEQVTKFGSNENVTTTSKGVWTVTAQDELIYPTTGHTIEAISSDANDTAAGTGARTIVIEGLDASMNEISTTLTMNGLTPTTASTEQFFRINRAYVATCGTYGGSNIGTITVRISGGGNIFLDIPVLTAFSQGAGQSLHAYYSVKAGYYAIMTGFNISSAASKTVNFSFEQRENADQTTAPFTAFRTFFHNHGISGVNPLVPPLPYVFDEKTDLKTVCVVDSGTAEFGLDFQMILVQKSLFA
jgi:hypothetical protein